MDSPTLRGWLHYLGEIVKSVTNSDKVIIRKVSKFACLVMLSTLKRDPSIFHQVFLSKIDHDKRFWYFILIYYFIIIISNNDL